MPDPAEFQEAFGLALARHPDGTGTALDRALAIHRNTSARAAQTALADNFPVVAALVGPDAFAASARDYVEQAPPTDPRLCLYGATFDAFLADYPPFADHPYLADVARVERMIVEALFAHDAEVRGPETFAQVDLDLPLRLHPAVRFATCASPAGALWLAHQDDAEPDALKDVEWQPECVLVTRPRNRIVVSVETPAVIAFIEACANGLPLGQAAGAAGDSLAEVFALTVSAGCFV